MRFFRSLDALAIHGESKLATYLMPTEASGGRVSGGGKRFLPLSIARAEPTVTAQGHVT